MPNQTFEVDVKGITYEVDAPDANTAWSWANQTHAASNQPAPKVQSGVIGATARGAARGLAPAAAGFTGAALGAEALVPIGAGIGTMFAPGLGTAIGGGIGALGGALLGGFGGGATANAIQDFALSHIPDNVKKLLGQDEEQRKADISQHPYASMVGEIAPQALFLSPRSGVAVARAGAGALERALSTPVAGRALGAALGGGAEALRERQQGQYDPGRLAIAAGAGGLLVSPTNFGKSILKPISGFTGRFAPETAAPSPEAEATAPVEAAPVSPPTPVSSEYVPAPAAEEAERLAAKYGTGAPKVSVDNPGGAWLAAKQRYAEEDMVKAARAGYAPGAPRGPVTGYTDKPLLMDPAKIANIPGAMKEMPGPGNPKYDALLKSMSENGYDPAQGGPLLIGVSHRGEPHIIEGNNRAAVARDLGLPALPVEVRYYAGGEQAPGRLSPDKLSDYLYNPAPRFTLDETPTPAAPAVGTAPMPMAAEAIQPTPKPEEISSVEKNKAGNINLNNINSTEDIKNVIRQTAAKNQNFTDARRGVLSLKDIEDLAPALGVSSEHLDSRKIGQAWSAEDLVGARKLLYDSAENVFEKSKNISGADDRTLADFQEAITKHHAIQEQVSGLTAEAGRALTSFRIKVGDPNQAAAIKKIIDSSGGREKIEDIGRMIAAINDSDQLSKFLNEIRKPTTMDKLKEVWINGLLSGPQTHVSNFLSNSVTAAMQLPETALASAMGAFRKGERVYPGEVGAKLFGLVQGVRDGARAGVQAFKMEAPSDLSSKVEIPRQNAISGVKGQLIRLPGRLLMSSDEMFKAMNARSELGAQAVMTAKKEGLSGLALSQRVSELIANPTDKMVDAAHEFAKYQTFTSDLSPRMANISRIINDPTAPYLKFVVPFFKTPTNIVKYALERTPAAVLGSEMRANLLGRNGPRAADLARSRLVLGTSIAGAVVSYALDGVITGGGPVDPGKRNVLLASGWQPYSIKIGNKYYSYARIEPISTIFGLASDMIDIGNKISHDDTEKLGNTIAIAIAKDLTNKTFLGGIGDALDSLSDPDRYGANWVNKLAGSIVPAGAAQLNRIPDPTLRQAKSLIDTIKSRTPGYSQDVAPRRDIFGEPIKYQGGPLVRGVSPIAQSEISKDPVRMELTRLDMSIRPPANKIKDIELSPQQYDKLQVTVGNLAKRLLDNLINSEKWPNIPDGIKKDLIQKSFEQANSFGRISLQSQDPLLLQKVLNSKIDTIKTKVSPVPIPPKGKSLAEGLSKFVFGQ